MLIWQKSFETGHATIDAQHQTLIAYINRLEGLLDTTNFNVEDNQFVITLVDYLESYVDKHFRFEEQCMESYRCPAHQQNKTAHAAFLAYFRQFRERCQAGGFRREILAELHQKIREWILGHILKIDLQLKPCIRQSGGQ